MNIVLGSSSPYRADLLRRIVSDFTVDSPNIDETPKDGECGVELANRLAIAKAGVIADRHPDSLVIACDQVAILNSEQGQQLLGKPGNFERALTQLLLCSGKQVDFYVACCVINAQTGSSTLIQDSYALRYKQLDEQTIRNYLHREQPYDCAGSIKSEGLGVALLASHHGSDPSTLIGLPLIKLTSALQDEGLKIL